VPDGEDILMGRITFITGGARSGKTAYALKRAMEHAAPRLYVATAEALDDEMRERIERHRKDREAMGFSTLEEPLDISAALKGLDRQYGAVLLDCLTLWLSNLMAKGLDAQEEGQKLLEALKGLAAPVYVVTNEVGLGIVPDNGLARAFRDNAGRLNAMMAAEAGEAWLMVSGLPVKIK
jgi:adenosylcobinamide kinase/adenosylcobinamide-phosphate guanylyltransferase